ncbi:MAG: signal peptide peptidase SppA [Candidatus Micrarchaeota archaeon]
MDKKLLIFGAIALIVLVIAGTVLLLVGLSSMPYMGSGCVAVVKVEGEIATSGTSGGLFGGGTTGSDDIAELAKEAEDRSDVKAVVFEINSPGGSVVASREIYESIKNVKKPKVAYFREVAASGGYYVSMGTDYIIANPDTITGSIGVISTHQELVGLFEKIGINETAITTGPHKDMGSAARPMTEEEKQIIRDIIGEMYDEFKGVVRESRGSRLDLSQFDKMTDGRVVTGRQALKAGLVDELGNKEDAIKKAAGLAGLGDDPGICDIAKPKGFFEEMFGAVGQGFGKALGGAVSAANPQGWKFGYR